MKRHLKRLAVAAVVGLGAAVGGVVAFAQAEDPSASLPFELTPISGSQSTFKVLSQAPVELSETLPADVPKPALGEPRLAASKFGANVYVAPDDDPDRICLSIVRTAADPSQPGWIVNCTFRSAAAAGRIVLPLRSGNPGDPAIVAGLVPDGVVGALQNGVNTPIEQNVFVIWSASGRLPGEIKYVTSGGETTEVNLGDDPFPPSGASPEGVIP